MLDFLMIATRTTKTGIIEIYPKFIIKKSSDLMIRGGDFYAIWVEKDKLWSTDEQEAIKLIDKELDTYVKEHKDQLLGGYRVLHLWDAESGMIDRWLKYCQKQMPDNFHMLDEKIMWKNTVTTKEDYASKKLPYPLKSCKIESYDKLMSTLYSPEERHKIEWAIGSIVSGDSKKLQKFMVLYGAAGTGKSTVLNIIQQLFEGYYSVFDARSLGSSSSSFALEAFKTNPLVAIQHDGDLSRIEDNTRLNSLVSHELMTVNEKFKSTYANRFKCFIFMGTNKPVKITDAKSGLIRRLIDVSPSGEKVSQKEYKNIMSQIGFELGGIALHCANVYQENPDAYDDYIPVNMLGASNDFFNFVLDSYHVFKKEDGTTLKQAWEMYKTYCEEAKVPYPYPQRIMKEELKNYFDEYYDRYSSEDGGRLRSYYKGFKDDKFKKKDLKKIQEKEPGWLEFKKQKSILDEELKDCPAQYGTADEKPGKKWSDVNTVLSDLDTAKLHYVKVPLNHIVIDFDIPDDTGQKSFEKNLEEANKWPRTYAELSKSGKGIHLHYIYEGDPKELSSRYDSKIEIKTFPGNSSLRRLLSLCNNVAIATISSGLPLKKKKGENMVNAETIQSEKGLRNLIERNLRKEIHPGTKPSIDFIYKILEDAYNDGLEYDVSDMYNSILAFAAGSSHQSDYCIKLVGKMKFSSEDKVAAYERPDLSTKRDKDDYLIFYDVEVFPNLFLVNWKIEGEGRSVVRMINPEPKDIEELLSHKLVGFNCRRYDNHIMYARLMGYDNMQLYKLSQKIIAGDKNCFFGAAYNLSYTDVYDFSSKKQSLKKFEIELGIHHQELGLPWDQPVPEELWEKVAEYCDNDVIATEAVFNARKADFVAREVLADLAGMTVNDTTNSLSTRIIFGNNRHPQDEFNYRFMGNIDEKEIDTPTKEMLDLGVDLDYTVFQNGKPVFPGYEFKSGRSTYRDEEVGEGGYVYAEPGISVDDALDDIASMHPSSIVAEDLFGRTYTKRFQEILDARIAIKHKDFAKARKMLNGVLAKYLDDENLAKDLAQALKIVINSVYGLTSATFENPFRDNRNKDNIVAKRGALFMINLKHEVQRRGYQVAHIKTDSIKIPEATPEILKFVYDYGQLYGYTFEHEATYDRMCLVNDAVYIAKYATAEKCESLYGYAPKDNQEKGGKWTATGTQFQVPYVFKALFSKEDIGFEDMCETKSVSSSLYLDMNENLPDVEDLEKKMKDLESKYKKGEINDTTFERETKGLADEIAKGHSYIFIGKVGSFCPVKKGCGGGKLMREKDGKYYAATGTKGFRWLESEMIKQLEKYDDIDDRYYNNLVDEAIDTISQYGDFNIFVQDGDIHDYFGVPFK